MENFENTTLTTFRCPPKIWKRYGNDIIVILSNYVALRLLVHINNRNEAIQFTVESENENGEIPFLDTRV